MSIKPTKAQIANRIKWVEALESGKFKQGQCALSPGVGMFCCLGVACEVFGVKPRRTMNSDYASYAGSKEGLPRSVQRKLGLDAGGTIDNEQDTLAEINDAGKGFPYIAAIIRAYLIDPFLEPSK